MICEFDNFTLREKNSGLLLIQIQLAQKDNSERQSVDDSRTTNRDVELIPLLSFLKERVIHTLNNCVPRLKIIHR